MESSEFIGYLASYKLEVYMKETIMSHSLVISISDQG